MGLACAGAVAFFAVMRWPLQIESMQATGDPRVDEIRRKSQWNLRVIEHVEEMQNSGKSFDEIQSYLKANQDNPPKDFRGDE